MTLEELLKEACRKGMTHLTLYPVESNDRKTIYWVAQASPSTGHQYVAAKSLDPIEAVTEVLTRLPKAPKRATKVTAPVSENENIGSTDWTKPETTMGDLDKPGDMDAWLPKG